MMDELTHVTWGGREGGKAVGRGSTVQLASKEKGSGPDGAAGDANFKIYPSGPA